MDRIYSALIPKASTAARSTIAKALAKYVPAKMLEFLADNGTRIRPLRDGELYREASPALQRLGIDVDAWPCAPAGLFVVEERTVYVRSLSPMTLIHESAHSLDCALGGGVYRSGVDPRWRELFAKAPGFVTPYAATGLDEAFAEAVRAMLSANDPASCWPSATPQRLKRVDPDTHVYMAALLEQFALAGEQMVLGVT